MNSDLESKRAKILYIEDDPASVALVSRLLGSQGHQVVTAADGLSAIESAKREKPDLILVDIGIAGLDGYEVTTSLRLVEKLKEVPIVAITAATLPGDRERALIAGCNGYIPKPIDVDRFPYQVRSFLLGMKEEIKSPEERSRYLVEYSRKLVGRLEAKIRELEDTHTELRRFEKVKSDFIRLASHELRTPLTCIYGYVQMLLEDPKISGDPGKEGSVRYMLLRIAKAAERLALVFDEIRNVSLIDTDCLELAWQPVTLEPLIHNVVRSLQDFGPFRELQFEFEGLRDLPVLIGDGQQLHQMFWNLISNAIKFTPDGGRISITGRLVDGAVHIVVQDTGVGIPPEDQEHIFDRFYVLGDLDRHHSSHTAFRGGGLGLGLTVARGIVEAHGGKMWVESEGYDEERLPGTICHVLLPVLDSPPSLPIASTPAATPGARSPQPGASPDREPSASG